MPDAPKNIEKKSANPVIRHRLSDQVYDRLWEMIVSGELAPGDTMPSERALMERFDVGRPAVREALHSLAKKGLINISHGERSRVNRLTAGDAFEQIDSIAKLLLSSEPENLAHLKQVRKILESGTVKIAATRCTQNDTRELRALVEKQRSYISEHTLFIRTDIEFHVRIAQITSNPLLEAITQAMLSWLLVYYTPLLHWSGHEDTTLLEHARIVDFLEKQDPEGAARLMADHLNRSDTLYNNI